MIDEDIFAWIGVVIMIIFYMYPSIPFFKLMKGTIIFGDAPVNIVYAHYCCCFMWIIYGFITKIIQVKVCSFICCISSFLLLAIELVYEAKIDPFQAILNGFALACFSLGAFTVFALIVEDENIIGSICSLISLGCCYFPLQLVYKAYKECNNNLIQIYPAIICAIGSICWFAYGLLADEFFILVSGGVGILISMIQIIAWKNFQNSLKGFTKIENNSVEIEDNESSNIIIEDKNKNKDNTKEKDFQKVCNDNDENEEMKKIKEISESVPDSESSN